MRLTITSAAAMTAVLAVGLAAATAGGAVKKAHKKILVVTHTTGFRHADSIPVAEKVIAELGQSNDLFYSQKHAIDLFDASGNPLTGDITSSLVLWDAGTEVNQAPGIGDEQAPRQKMANTGKAENGKVGEVKDAFTYPNTKDVMRVTITVE